MPESTATTAHSFLPVAEHPDDDECTHREDGTDATYCGEPEAAHQPAACPEGWGEWRCVHLAQHVGPHELEYDDPEPGDCDPWA